MSSLESGEPRSVGEARAFQALRNLEVNAESPEALRDAVLALKLGAEELIRDAKAEAARVLTESASVAERLTEESRAAAAAVEQEIAMHWEQIVREREKLDREIAEWKASAVPREATVRDAGDDREHALTGNRSDLRDLAHEEEQLRRRIAEHRDQLVSMLQSALSELEPLELSATSQSDVHDLSSALTTRVSPGASAKA